MPRSFTATLSLSLGGDTPTWEGEATVWFTVDPAEAERPATYAHGGSPAVPASVVDVMVTHIDGQPIAEREHGKHEAETLENHIECSDRLMARLLELAAESEVA